MMRRAVLLLGVSGLFVSQGQAAEITLKLRYQAETRTFQNLTPRSSVFCAQLAHLCSKPLESLVGVDVAYHKRVEGDQADGFYLSRPSTPSVVHLNRDGTAEQARLEVAITHIGGALQWVEGSPALAGPQPGACQVPLASGGRQLVLWSIPGNGCWSNSGAAGPSSYDVSDLTLGYSLKMPSAASLKSGVYRGRLVYSIGPDKDIGLGSSGTVSRLSSDSLTINVELDIKHDLDVRFEPGSERVALAPRDGWRRTADRRGLPGRLEKDVPFTLTASGPFNVWATCAASFDGACGLQAPNGHSIPLFLAMSLPGVSLDGKAVHRQPLAFGAEPLALAVSGMGVNSSGQLHFHALPRGRGDTDAMMPGMAYETVVTVVFDASP